MKILPIPITKKINQKPFTVLNKEIYMIKLKKTVVGYFCHRKSIYINHHYTPSPPHQTNSVLEQIFLLQSILHYTRIDDKHREQRLKNKNHLNLF